MWRWAGSSDLRAAIGVRVTLVRAMLAATALLIPATPATSGVFLTLDEALALAFPDCRIERRTVFLTEAQSREVQRLAGERLPSAMLSVYEATLDGEHVGTAYLDSHRVRTLPETIMVVVDPAGAVQRIEVLSFDEPPDYLPGKGWYKQYAGKQLDKDLGLGRAIRGVTGATLTARATTGAVRRVLALHRVLAVEQAP